MDLWVVAAAAGAGYLAKYWKNVLKDNEGSPGSNSGRFDEPQSPSLIERIRDKTCPVKKLSRVRSDIGLGDQSGEIFAETSRRDGPVGRDGTWSSALDQEQQGGIRDDGSVPSHSMFSPEFRNDKKYRGGYGLDADMSDIPEDSTWETGASHASRRSRNSVRSRRLQLQVIKPRSSLDSCLMAQMHRDHAELEEYLRTPLSSPCTPSFRPFLVSDGKRVISRSSGEFRDGFYQEDHLKAAEKAVGVPRLPQINAVDYAEQKFSSKNQIKRPQYSSYLMPFDTQAGISSVQPLFFLGISIGILSTIIANKVELEKLKYSLKQSENLVEDLQDELEMKDSLTVKELTNDDDSQDILGISSGNENLDVFSNQTDTNVLVRYADEDLVSPRKNGSISNIEAELEAELERLELSMKRLTLPGELNQESDKDVVAELVYGELQADLVRRISSSDPTPDRGTHSIPTPQSVKDGVSPRALSLRLHEVIQLRLEELIMELEAELAKSQKHIQHLITERSNCWRDVSNSGSSSSRCSPRAREILSPNAQPLIMNLSGDALDAYNEAFGVLNNLNELENESSRVQVNKQSTEDGQMGFRSNTWLADKREEAEPISITGIPSSEDSPNDSYNSDDDDDMLLIKQIVEKAREGSPAILRAQKAMVSLVRDH